MNRFFLDIKDIQPGMGYSLSPEESRHLSKVLRLSRDDRVIVFNGKGGEFLAKIEDSSHDEARVMVLESIKSPVPEPATQISIVVPLTDQSKLEFIMEKGTELGVSAFHLYRSERSHSHTPVAALSDSKIERLRKKIISAAKQCGRALLPEIKPPCDLNEILQQFSADEHMVKILPWEKCDSPLISELLTQIDPVTPSGVCVIIGPEGGFTKEEYQESVDVGFAPCSLGSRILRLETAVVVSLSLVLSWMKEL